MISKERLEELIEQGETIFSNEYGEIQLIKENDLILYAGHNNYILYILKPNKKYHYKIFDEDLFETLEEAEWHKEFGCIERIERLELPTWEELFKKERVLDCYTQEFAIVENKCVIGIALFGVDFTCKIIEVNIGGDKLFVGELTKENYTLACRKCKELFLGENKCLE